MDTEIIEDAVIVFEHKPLPTRRRKPCGWWSCRVPSFAQKTAMCPHCKRPKSGPREGR